MIYYTAKTPVEYQNFFHRQLGLPCIREGADYRMWENPQVGFIRSFGSIDKIQTGVGNYSVPSDFLVEYQYESHYLHFGIVFEGITYSMIENEMVATSIPSAFLIVKNTTGGINCWRKGQQFKGIEVSIEMKYLQEQLLPFLGYSDETPLMFEENVHYTNLSEEMRQLILRMEELIHNNRMTGALQTAHCLEFLALLFHPENQTRLLGREESFYRQIRIGKRQIRITKDDYKKIKCVHERIRQDAASFRTIADFSRELQISEQKLKAGFQDIYQQTIWDYANTIRMNQAVFLLNNTGKSVSEISTQIGYQSQAAFINMFKKWCGITPGQFRLQIRTANKSL